MPVWGCSCVHMSGCVHEWAVPVCMCGAVSLCTHGAVPVCICVAVCTHVAVSVFTYLCLCTCVCSCVNVRSCVCFYLCVLNRLHVDSRPRTEV